MLGRSQDTRTQAVFPAGQTALGRSPCQGGATTHVHRRSSLQARPHSAGRRVREEPRHTYTGGLPCRPDRTRQVAVSGRSRDTRSQAVKSLPARQHSAGRRVREEPRHTFTGGQIPAGQTALTGRRVREEPRHTYTGGHPCRPDRTQLVTVPGRSHDTHTHVANPVGQTALSWSPSHAGRSRDTDTHVANPVGHVTLIKILQAHLS